MTKRDFAKQNSLVALMIIMICTFLCACGKKDEEKQDFIGDISSNTLIFNDDGSIREIACMDFSGVTYDISDLKSSIEASVSDYTGLHGKDSIKLLQYDEEGGFVRVAIDYESLKTYNLFNNTKYEIGGSEKIPEDEILISLGGVENTARDVLKSDFKVLVFDGDYTIRLDGGLLYYNEHVTDASSKTELTTDGKGTAYIVYQ